MDSSDLRAVFNSPDYRHYHLQDVRVGSREDGQITVLARAMGSAAELRQIEIDAKPDESADAVAKRLREAIDAADA